MEGRGAHAISGSPDDLTFHSGVSLFAAADPAEPLFPAARARFFGGAPDRRTIGLLSGPGT